MLLQDIVQSDKERLGKKIVESQKKDKEESWYSETEVCKGYEIEIEKAELVKKKDWKRMVKEGIKKKIEKEMTIKEQEMRKMRHQVGDKFERKLYVKEMGVGEVAEIMRTRLELWDIGNNQGKNRKCVCDEKETVEHIMECEEIRSVMVKNNNKEWLRETRETWKLKEITRWIKEYIERRDG